MLSTKGPGTSGLDGKVPPSAKRTDKQVQYVPLNELKVGTVVNVYGVVTFFKLPFSSKGTDLVSTLKITDESGAKVTCIIFGKTIEDHPSLKEKGDIVRLHRFKAESFNDSVTLKSSFGWSVVTFSGVNNSPIVPLTSSKKVSIGEFDERKICALRQWAADESLFCQSSKTTLSSVWDGTRCEYPLQSYTVASDAVEGEDTEAKDRRNLTAYILVYDNHLEVARDLKPGMFLQFYNLRAVLAKDLLPNEPQHLTFHLHSGTSFGRSLRRLPDEALEQHKDLNDDEVPEDVGAFCTRPEAVGPSYGRGLRRLPDDSTHEPWALEQHKDLNDDEVPEDVGAFCTRPEAVGQVLVKQQDLNKDEVPKDVGVFCRQPEAVETDSCTVRACKQHHAQHFTLEQVRSSTPPQLCHIRARVKDYQPQQLSQKGQARVKQRFLNSMWEADGSRFDQIHRKRQFVFMNSHEELKFIQGTSLGVVCASARCWGRVIPVRAVNEKMALMDFFAPFIFYRGKRFYGCQKCSLPEEERRDFFAVEPLDLLKIAEALRVQLMEYRFLLQFELDDGTGTVDALLWENADKIRKTMDTVHPPDKPLEERPWMDLCLFAYTVEGNVCYQIVNTKVKE
ncbi:hypothetical protein DNTS_009308 [Danionella cerebrum]|uniref:Protection of telomeres protein 1 n=1 Tax=Danionella cerebrum TaxID=2873325 RepID=A0A553Q8N2_9TELE|nr:hypothetical protein DNTS_009308 [Danionella translucida]